MSDDLSTTKIPDTDRDVGASEAALIEARRAKAERVRGRSENPFANDVGPRLGGRTVEPATPDALATAGRDAAGKYDAAKVAGCEQGELLHVRGRVVRLRSTGGLTFPRIRDRTGEIQLFVSEDQADASGALDDLDVGDVVEAEGALMTTKRGELSIQARRLRLVTKAYRPLPDKWSGLSDVELRYRQRYVDLIANPAVADVFRARTHIVRAARTILRRERVPRGSRRRRCTCSWVARRRGPFETHHNALDMHLFMRIAPELHLKRLLVGGLERVYQIARCYRTEGVSTRHNPRVHDARVLPGVRDVRRPARLHRGPRARDRRAARRGDARSARGSGRRRGRSRSTRPSSASRWTTRSRSRRAAPGSPRGRRPRSPTAAPGIVPPLARRVRERDQRVGEKASPRAKEPRLGEPPEGPREVRDGRRAPLRALRVPGRAVPLRGPPNDRRGPLDPGLRHGLSPSRISPLARRSDTSARADGPLRALRARPRALQRVPASSTTRTTRRRASGRRWRGRPGATTRRWTTTPTTSGRSSTACRRRRGSGWE